MFGVGDMINGHSPVRSCQTGSRNAKPCIQRFEQDGMNRFQRITAVEVADQNDRSGKRGEHVRQSGEVGNVILSWLSIARAAANMGIVPRNADLTRKHMVTTDKSGCRWCDCPEDYGPSTTIYNRFNRWSRRGFWTNLLDALAEAGAVTKSTVIDSTYI